MRFQFKQKATAVFTPESRGAELLHWYHGPQYSAGTWPDDGTGGDDLTQGTVGARPGSEDYGALGNFAPHFRTDLGTPQYTFCNNFVPTNAPPFTHYAAFHLDYVEVGQVQVPTQWNSIFQPVSGGNALIIYNNASGGTVQNKFQAVNLGIGEQIPTPHIFAITVAADGSWTAYEDDMATSIATGGAGSAQTLDGITIGTGLGIGNANGSITGWVLEIIVTDGADSQAEREQMFDWINNFWSLGL